MRGDRVCGYIGLDWEIYWGGEGGSMTNMYLRKLNQLLTYLAIKSRNTIFFLVFCFTEFRVTFSGNDHSMF